MHRTVSAIALGMRTVDRSVGPVWPVHGSPYGRAHPNRPVAIVPRIAVGARRSARTSLLCLSFAFFAFYYPPRRVGVIFGDKWHQILIANWQGAAVGDAARTIYPMNELKQ